MTNNARLAAMARVRRRRQNRWAYRWVCALRREGFVRRIDVATYPWWRSEGHVKLTASEVGEALQTLWDKCGQEEWCITKAPDDDLSGASGGVGDGVTFAS